MMILWCFWTIFPMFLCELGVPPLVRAEFCDRTSEMSLILLNQSKQAASGCEAGLRGLRIPRFFAVIFAIRFNRIIQELLE